VTEACKVASDVSSLERATVSSELVSVLRETVAVVAPRPSASLTESIAKTIVNSGMSLSVTSSVSVPSTCTTADAVTVTVCVPSTISSSMAWTLKEDEML